MAIRFRSFRTRLLFFFLGLLALALLGMLIAANAANMRSAQIQIEEDLKVAGRVFQSVVENRIRQLEDGAFLLSSDSTFRRAIATDDHLTIISALANLKSRINSDGMKLVSNDHTLIADTARPEARDEKFAMPELIRKARTNGQASSITFIDGLAHQVVVAPVLSPAPIAWLTISFVIDKAFLQELQKVTVPYISLFRVSKNGEVDKIASTLSDTFYGRLHETLPGVDWNIRQSMLLNLGGNDYVSLFSTLSENENFVVYAVLQRSMEDALKPYYRLRTWLIALVVMALALSFIAGVFIAGTVSKPVLKLAEGVKEIEKGNYDYEVTVTQHDEIGELAAAFNRMTKGLAERDKVRNLLGKVVSPAVAHDLLSREEIRLGGEERVMTALFSDMAEFTSIAENLTPTDLVSLLNEYLSALAEVIDGHGGSVDKFIGDEIVAFWGAPFQVDNHAELSVLAALEMQDRLHHMRVEWRKEDRLPLYMRVGIATGPMIVGNMGSKDRMNYTMIGDSVNLASRLESANKYYGSNIMISESTYTEVREKFCCRELDIVRVQGKTKPIKIYEVLGKADEVSTERVSYVRQFEDALKHFRRLDFEKAVTLFEKCNRRDPTGDKACDLYLRRISEFTRTPPPVEWDKVYTLAK